MWAASAALVPASTSGSRNTLAVSLFETRSIGEAVMGGMRLAGCEAYRHRTQQ